MAVTAPFPCSSSCAIRRSRSPLTSASATSVGGWIEENWRITGGLVSQLRGTRRRCSTRLVYSQARNAGFGSGRCVSLTTSSTTCQVEASVPCCGNDGVGFACVQPGGDIKADKVGCECCGPQPWPWLEGARGWILGLAMACLVVAGGPASSESQAAMQAPRAPRTGYDPVSEEEREASSAFARRVTEALELLDMARKAQASDDFPEALRCYSLQLCWTGAQITQKSGDLALAEYARVGRALTLYEDGDRSQAILEMEDMSLSLKGYPEVHAALAAALYADKHAPVPAEQQFTFATLLDPRYTDPSWVKSAKHWPPSLVASLQRFIALK